MPSDIFQRNDLSIYLVAGVPRSFKKDLADFVEESARGPAEVKLVKDEMRDWMLAKLEEDDRRSHERTQASAALWRAFRALSAARYHLHRQDEAFAEQIRQLRNEIEELWASVSPLHKETETTSDAA